MATPKARSKPAPTPVEPEVVDPVWLLKAGGLVVLAAIFCGYLTLCLLVYQGQWQLVLHPDKTRPNVLASPELPLQVVRFGANASGQPSLAGWWIPGEGSRASDTILFLHDGSGNLATNTAPLEALHAAGVSILAFDYRGFGASDPTHPTQLNMTQDAESALDYLVNTRHLPAKTIVPCGAGLGASLALTLAANHSELAAVVAESPNPDVYAQVHADPRAGLVPLGLLFNQRFDLNLNLKTPKLLLTTGPSPVATKPSEQALDQLFHQAAAPSFIDRPPTREAYIQSITRFLDEYLPAGPAQLAPARP